MPRLPKLIANNIGIPRPPIAPSTANRIPLTPNIGRAEAFHISHSTFHIKKRGPKPPRELMFGDAGYCGMTVVGSPVGLSTTDPKQMKLESAVSVHTST